MGLVTFAVALVPTCESIGIWGAAILTVLRFVQGIGVGGESGGSDLMPMEWARTESRRFVAFASRPDRRKLYRPARLQRLLGYQLASIIAGSPASLIAAWLFGTYHSSYAIAIYIAVCAVMTLIATALMTDNTGKDISGEYKSKWTSRLLKSNQAFDQ
jgi:MFS family permease